jgi:hypothetical protein
MVDRVIKCGAHQPRRNAMKKSVVFATLALMLVATFVVAETTPKLPKTYQATGPIVALTDDVISVDKGKEGIWEIARSKDAKVTGDLKVGAKVTITYRMTAATIEVKAETKPEVKKKK